MALTHDKILGVIVDGDIRYLTLRADVLMGIAKELPFEQRDHFFVALERSVFHHVQSSLTAYQRDGRFEGADFFRQTCAIAATLGWGAWIVADQADGTLRVEVRNSPFAAGYGPSTTPVCAAAVGVLKALLLATKGSAGRVTEVACTSQGHNACQFQVG